MVLPRNIIHIIISTILFLIIIISYLLMALKFPFAYITATYEDFFGEWAQVFLFISVFALSIRLAFLKSGFRLFLIVLTLASFYTFMEEISWGQRIFNIEPPEFFLKHNLQRETNIHNFITGPYNTSLKNAIEYLLFAGLIFYGLIYPAALKMRIRIAEWIESKGLLAPPLYLWPYFVFSAVLELGLFNFNEAEIAEILIPLALNITLIHYLFTHNNPVSSRPVNQTLPDKSVSRKISFAMSALFLLSITFSLAATYSSYTSPRLKNAMYGKYLRGVEKFAGRYKQYGMWSTAVSLYEVIDEEEPDRPSIQRNLALCYRNMGDTEKEKEYLENAFDIDLKKLEEFPESISANLSLAMTYKQTGEFIQEKHHLDTALDIALERVANKPRSSSATFWLGKTYEQRGDTRSAFTYYEKAFTMKPNKKKYRSAYMRTMSLKGESEEIDQTENNDNE